MSNVFDITDYGAVLDDSTNCGPAIDDALDAAIAAGGGTILHPGGGIARVTAGFVPKVCATNVNGFYEFVGADPSACYRLDTIGNTSLFGIVNAGCVRVADLVIIGDPGVSGDHISDSYAILHLQSAWETIVERVRLLGISCTGDQGPIYINNSRTQIRDIFAGGISCPETGVLYSASNVSLSVQGFTVIDYHAWKTVNYNKTAVSGNAKYWIRVDTTGDQHLINPVARFKDLHMDESIGTAQVFVDGGNVMSALFENVFINAGGGRPSISVDNLKRLKVTDMEVGWWDSPHNSIVANDTDLVDLDGLQNWIPGSGVQLTGSSKRLRMRNCENVLPTVPAGAVISTF